MRLGFLEIVTLLFFIGISVFFALICAHLAKSKGRDSLVWGFLGFIFNIFTLIVLLISPRVNYQKQDNTKK